MLVGGGSGGLDLFGMVGPNRDFESGDAVAVDEGSGAFALGDGLDEDAADDVAPADVTPDDAVPAVTVSGGLRRNIHAAAIRSTIASKRMDAIRGLLPLGFCGAFP